LKKENVVNVTINDSLFLSATKAGLSERFTMELAHLFGWDIDFALDIRKGDSFSVLFNEHFLDGEKIQNGQILAAEFTNQGKLYESIYFTDQSGKGDYYSSDGYSKRKAFLRTPVAFSRISSRFSKSRKHPVLKRTRAHKGVDYAAPRGTPIKSSGDGKVSFIGRKGGYGKVIQIQHGSKYKTVYGHMSSFNKKLKRGSRVKQGQVIGYVGSTGVATGPHLHYEFRVNGVHRNPLTVSLPKANPINKKYRVNFLQYSENILSSLKLKKHEHLALLQE
jgi:murein DD-endopeptidase MepM/ murein hydrolase activator NlpD